MEIDRIIVNLKKGEIPTESVLTGLIERFIAICLEEPSLLDLTAPITLIGDIHGQFYDLRELIRIAPELPSYTFLFMGDLVDRGFHSVETLLFVIALKIKYPTRLYLLRGNHESGQLTKDYGFYDEVIRKFGNSVVYNQCLKLFDALPLAALVQTGNLSVFCVHGGIGPRFRNISDIAQLYRRDSAYSIEYEAEELLWSDPEEIPASHQLEVVDGFPRNQRGSGYYFNRQKAEQFCTYNNVAFITRSHQLTMDGYKFLFDNRVLTVWSAPNYCYRSGNVGCICEISDFGEMSMKIFEQAQKSRVQQQDGKPVIPAYFM